MLNGLVCTFIAFKNHRTNLTHNLIKKLNIICKLVKKIK